MIHQTQQSMLMQDGIIFQLYPNRGGVLQGMLSQERMQQVTRSQVVLRRYLRQTMNNWTSSFRIRTRE